MAIDLSVLKPTDSSMFSEAGYDDGSWILLLRFKSTGELRGYREVVPEMGAEALAAESLGKYFRANIMNNDGWQFDVLEEGHKPEPKPKVEKPAPKPVASDEMAIKNEDIAYIDELIKKESKVVIATEVSEWKEPDSGELRPLGPGDVVFASAEIVKQPSAELLNKWPIPESAAEALDLMTEHNTEIKAIITASKQTGEQALTVRVNDADSRLKASDVLNAIVGKKDKTNKALDPFRKVLYEAYTEAGNNVKAALTPLDNGIAHLKRIILAWDNEQDRLRREAQRKAQEAAEAEARRRQEEESQRLTLAEVQTAIEEGDEQRAQSLFDEPIQAPKPYVAPVIIPPSAPKVEGQSTSKSWKVDQSLLETDEQYAASITKLLSAVKEGRYDIAQAAALLQWDMTAANKLAGALGSAFNVPGLTVKEESTLRVGGGRGRKSSK